MEVLIAILVGMLGVGAFYAMSRRYAAMACELAIPFDGAELPRQQVKDTLERMGCIISQDQPDRIAALLRGSMADWPQELTVTVKNGRLLVRSAFSSPQVSPRSWRGSRRRPHVAQQRRS